MDQLLTCQLYHLNRKVVREMERCLQIHQLKMVHLNHLLMVCQLFHMIQRELMDKQHVGRAKREAGILIERFEQRFYREAILLKQISGYKSRPSKTKTNLQQGCILSVAIL